MSGLVLSIVVPCYNEAPVLPETRKRLESLLRQLIDDQRIAARSRVWFVDDGSRDATWPLIHQASLAPESLVCGIKLTRNRGHQAALMAGLMTASGDVLVSVDADLQDDLSVIPQMLTDFAAGNEIVYAARRKRSSDTFFKRFSAEGYYKLLAALGVDVVFNHADYRLMSRRAIEAMRQYREPHLFLRALVPQLGYRSSVVEFDRAERFAGESKYPLRKMLAFAWDGITSFTAYPLRLITGIGLAISMLSLWAGVWALIVVLFTSRALPGWASTVIPVYFLGGVQLLGLGMIGEYVAKVFEATKQRPLYHVETITGPGVGPVIGP